MCVKYVRVVHNYINTVVVLERLERSAVEYDLLLRRFFVFVFSGSCVNSSQQSTLSTILHGTMEAVVLYEYTAQEADELTLTKGDIVTDIKVRDGGWWEGTNKDGKRGFFPDNFVKTISENFTTGLSETTLRGKKFVVKFNYIPVNVDELELKVGDIVELISEIEEGWWEGRLNNKIGVFPSNFVSEIPEPEIETNKSTVEKNDCRAVPNQDEINPDTEKMEVDESRTSPNVSMMNDAPVLPPKPKPVKEMCVALFPYEAKHDDELTLKENDTILLLSTDLPDKGWWKGQLNGKIGVFPDNFVKLITLSDEVDKPQRPAQTKSTTNKSRDSTNNKQTTNSNVAALRKSLETPVKPIDESIANPSKKPTVSKKPGFSPSNSSDAMKNLFTTSSPIEKAPLSPDHNINTSRSSCTSDTSASFKSIESDVKSWTETTDDSRKTRSFSSSMNDKLNAELQNSFASREMDNTDGSSASKISTANNSDSRISNHDFEAKEKFKEIDLNVIERSEILTHPTAFRAKAPKRRPPSGINFKEDDVPVPNNKIHNSKVMINGNANPKAAPWLQELKLNQLKKNSSQVNIRGGFTSSGSNVTFRFQRPVSMFSSDAEAQSLSFHSKSLPPSNEDVAVVTNTSITDTVTSSSFEKVVTVSVSDWNALLEKVNSLEIRLEKQNEYFTKTIDQLKSKLASEVSLRADMKHEIDKLTELVTQV